MTQYYNNKPYQRRRRGGRWAAVICLLLLLFLAAGYLLSPRGPAAALAQRVAAGLTQAQAPAGEWNLILVNSSHAIPVDYQQELTLLDNGQEVDSRIYPALQEMFDAARAQGYDPFVASGWRSWDKQQSLLDDKTAAFVDEGLSQREAEQEALAWVARPGYSEHQLGLCVDVNAVSRGGDQAVYDWLAQNSYLYGFVLRYPADKEEITLTACEPWHFRYVGLEAARTMYEENLCLEEYLQKYY